MCNNIGLHHEEKWDNTNIVRGGAECYIVLCITRRAKVVGANYHHWRQSIYKAVQCTILLPKIINKLKTVPTPTHWFKFNITRSSSRDMARSLAVNWSRVPPGEILFTKCFWNLWNQWRAFVWIRPKLRLLLKIAPSLLSRKKQIKSLLKFCKGHYSTPKKSDINPKPKSVVVREGEKRLIFLHLISKRMISEN